MSVLTGVEHDLKALPKDLAESALAESARRVAQTMDGFDASAAEIASCARALESTMSRLRELAPPREVRDGVDEIAERRARRRAGGTATKG